jgi:hypothetical protein
VSTTELTPLATIAIKYCHNRANTPMITLNLEAQKLFPSGNVILSYSGAEIRLREATIDDSKSLTVSNKSGTFSAGALYDVENWIGKHELLQSGDWFIFEKLQS